MRKNIPKTILQEELGSFQNELDAHYRQKINLFVGGAFPGSEAMIRNVILFTDHGDHSKKRANMHNRYALILNLRENLKFVCDGIDYDIPPDHWMLVFPMQRHSYRSIPEPERHLRLHLMFSVDQFADDSLQLLRNQVFAASQMERRFLAMIFEIMFSAGKAYQTTVPHLMNGLFSARIADLHQQLKLSANPENEDEIMEKALSFIRKNFNRPLRIKTISTEVGVSESHLRVLFRRSRGGLSCGKFVRDLRLFNAQELLGYTRLPLADIARRCGYSNPFSFCRAFKTANNGLSPSVYRKKYRAEYGLDQ